jgi:hypothetical protein
MARRKPAAEGSFFHRNGLSVVFGLFMLLSLALHAVTGWRVENRERVERGQPTQELAEYVGGGHFQSTLFENWESEFLQMALFVVLTVSLRQKGSSESRKMDPAEEKAEQKKFPASVQPWAARQKGLVRVLYEHSLSLALFVLFALSFVGHWIASWRQHAEEALAEGGETSTLLEHLWSAEFWFESMQNWQSEFLAVLAIVLLSIWLREKDSSQSKQVEAPHSETGV